MARALAIVPARYASSRYPGKSLAPLKDKPVIQWVWEGVRASKRIERVLVATDDERIAAAVRGFGGEAVMTAADIPSGTDRAAGVARVLDYDVVVNVQGDEPMITGTSLDRLVEALEADTGLSAASLREPLESADDLFDPNVVKVVCSAGGDAIYFSRSPIPYFREGGRLAADFREALSRRGAPLSGYWRHVGVYAFRKAALLDYAATPRTPLEEMEGLEQLRLLETGRRLRLVDSDFRSVAVDTPEDLHRAVAALEHAPPARGI